MERRCWLACGILAATVLGMIESRPSQAEPRRPGHYSGVVFFDRWDSCILCNGGYIHYISEAVKEPLRSLNRSETTLLATKVLQPINPGDGLIQEYLLDHLPPPETIDPAGEGLRSQNSLSTDESGSIVLTMTLTNTSSEEKTVFARQLSPTLLTTFDPANRGFIPADGRSHAIVTRYTAESLLQSQSGIWFSGVSGRNAQIKSDDRPLEVRNSLLPGHEIFLSMKSRLPDGEYQFFSSYSASHSHATVLQGNPISFDVKDGKAQLVK